MTKKYESEINKLIIKIKQQREKLKAPVDIFGCKAIGKNNKLKILIALLLSSQTKDQVTYEAVKNLSENLKNGLTLKSLKLSSTEEINYLIRKVGFHNKKSIFLKEIANQCYENGLPTTFEEVLKLPGVGSKMAILYMQHAHDEVVGISVDTHVHRVSNRIGLVNSKNPESTRIQLQEVIEKEDWHFINSMFVGFGQMVCLPINPKCKECFIKEDCKFQNEW